MSRDSQKVVVAYPYGHEVSARFHHSLVQLLVADAKGNRRIIDGGFLGNSSGANVTNARNEIVVAFLDSLDADWLLFVDTDMTFEPDLVERMVRAAHPERRPILGALAFSLQRGQEAAPTLYVLREDGKVGRLLDYPRDQLAQVNATGTGCMLIHRSVLTAMRESGRFPAAYPWFQETHTGVLPIGEDITFCIRAGALGFPVHVDTSIKVGHEKPFIVDESMFLAQQALRRSVPTIAVVPVRKADDPIWADDDIGVPVIRVPNDGPLNISKKWNHGLDQAETATREAGHDRWNVLVLNDDVDITAEAVTHLAAALRSDGGTEIAYPDCNGLGLKPGQVAEVKGNGQRTMAGWCFMVRGESGLRADERFEWWYGDDDLQRQVETAGHKVVAVGCDVRHLHPNESTEASPELQATARLDKERYAAKWGAS